MVGGAVEGCRVVSLSTLLTYSVVRNDFRAVVALLLIVLVAGCAPEPASVPEDPAATDMPTAESLSISTARTDAASAMASEHADVIAEVAELDGYGGVHLRNDVGLVVSVTSEDVEAARRILERGLPPDGHWTVREVRWPLRQLEDAADAVWEAAEDLEAIGVELTATSVSHATNTLTVNVDGDQDAARALLTELLSVEFAVRGPTRVAQTGTG